MTDPILIILGVLGGLVLILIAWCWHLTSRLKRLLGGQKAANIEDAMVGFGNALKETQTAWRQVEDKIQVMDNRLRKSVQHVKTIRFNPFPDQGGKQSFATAFLDERGNGVVVSSLYARDKMSVYAKPIERRQSEYELSVEEAAALETGE